MQNKSAAANVNSTTSGATAAMLMVLRQRVLKGWQSGESMDKVINQLSLSSAFEEDIQCC